MILDNDGNRLIAKVCSIVFLIVIEDVLGYNTFSYITMSNVDKEREFDAVEVVH